MPFVKLDCGILNSTLWIDPVERDIFITALLMAVPFEFKTAQPQLVVNEILETGFVVPPGWYGMVEAAGPGIVRRALLEQEAGMRALAKLGEPDPGSRSRAWDGRRLVRVDGGYLVLNYMDYLLKDYGAAERMRRLRAKKRDTVTVTGNRVTRTERNPTPDSDGVTRTVTYTDTYTDADQNKNSLVKSVADLSLLPTASQKTRAKPRRAIALPPDFLLTQERRNYALSKEVTNLEKEFEAFRAHHEAHGKVMKSWDAAWRTWCLNAKKFRGNEPPRGAGSMGGVLR